jgi:Flp pilus assembly protein TadD
MKITVLLKGIVIGQGSIAVAYGGEQVCDVRADYALGVENYAEAIRLHEEFLASHPDDALAHYHLGFAYSMRGRRTQELREYRKAVTLRLDQWDLFLNLALADLEGGDLRRGIDALRVAAKLGPDHEEAHFNLALAYEQADRLSEALQEISAALFLELKDPEAHNMRAVIYAKLGDFKRAREEWIYLTRAVPGYVPAYRNLAVLDEMRDERPSSSYAITFANHR